MFGNSSSYNNIFGGALQESHKRQFGGDRMLSTKDIEGAQPRKYNRHIWGDYQNNPQQNPLSFDPQKSTIKSTILGDNVQPLNRGIPNSQGMIFRDPQYQSLTKMYTQPNATNFRSPQSKQQEPSQALPYTSVNDRKQNLNSLSFSNAMRDSKNQPYQVNSPVVYQPNTNNEKIHVKKIEPPSQLREQNIFSLPDYTNQSVAQYLKPMVNVGSQSTTNESTQGKKQDLNVAQKMDFYKQIHSVKTVPANILTQPHTATGAAAAAHLQTIGSSRSPDSYIPFEPTPKDYQRDSISSYALGIKKDPAVEKYHPNKELFYQQPSTLPLFQQNRNFGPDDVLKGPQSIDQRDQTSSYEFGSFASPRQNPGNKSPINQQDNIRPNSNRYESQQQLQQNEVKLNFQGEQQIVRPPSNQSKVLAEAERLLLGTNTAEIKSPRAFEDKVLSQSQIPQRPPSNPQYLGRPASTSQLLKNSQYQPQNIDVQASNDTMRLRSVLSSRARQLLNSKQINTTANNEYGLYTLNSNRQGEPPKEKVLYQSKRDNFLRSHLARSQSAEGTRINRNNVVGADEQNSILNRAVPASSYLPKYGQWGLRSYNIIGNYMYPYKYEGRRGDPFADQKYLGKGISQNNLRSSKQLASANQVEGQNQGAASINNNEQFNRSGQIRSPVAGMSNDYDETNRKFNIHYHKQQVEPHAIKYYGAKALKNLSNIKLY